MPHPFRDARELSRWLHGTGMVAVCIIVTKDLVTIYNPQYKYNWQRKRRSYQNKAELEKEVARIAASKWDVARWGRVKGLDGLFSWESLKLAQSEYPDLDIRSSYVTEQFLDIY